MIVVADTSPVNYLMLLGHIEILAKIYVEVVVPQTVLDELQDNDAPAKVRAWFSAPGMAACLYGHLSARPPHA
jgi:predicted nucleic acid-binding protein